MTHDMLIKTMTHDMLIKTMTHDMLSKIRGIKQFTVCSLCFILFLVQFLFSELVITTTLKSKLYKQVYVLPQYTSLHLAEFMALKF